MPRLIALWLFCACFASFAWGMARFFLVADQVPVGVRIVKGVGGAMVLLHFVMICRANDVSVAWLSAAASLYVASFSLFWSAVSVHRRRPPTLCYSSDVPEHLIVSGPYRWMRHPFYASYMLAWLAGALAAREPWLLVSLVLMSGLYIRAALLEERKFAASPVAVEFAHYRDRTGMFVPRITRNN